MRWGFTIHASFACCDLGQERKIGEQRSEEKEAVQAFRVGRAAASVRRAVRRALNTSSRAFLLEAGVRRSRGRSALTFDVMEVGRGDEGVR